MTFIYILECFKSTGSDLSTPLCFECVVIACSECYEVFSLFRGVLHIWATVKSWGQLYKTLNYDLTNHWVVNT